MVGIREDKNLKISAFTHFAALLSLLIVAVLTIGVLFWLRFDDDFVLVLSIWFLINALPALYLHFEYWLKNTGEKYKITTNEIIQYKRNAKREYKKEDIEKIIIYKSASIDKGGIPILAIESYHYARIVMKTGEELILTCLLAKKIDEELKQIRGILFERKKRGFCSVFWK